jgi:hypothetical protein
MAMASRRRFLKTGSVAAFTLLGAQAAPRPVRSAKPIGDEPGGKAGPTPEKDEGLDFEAERIQGTMRGDGAYHGVTRLVDKRTGRQVIDPRYSALNLFRLFSVNQGMGQPRKMDRTIRVSSDSLEIKWPATDAHHAEIAARYEVSGPSTVDVAVTVQSQGAYRGYELFMSNYFDKSMRPHVFLKPSSRGRTKAEPELVLPTVNDVFRGTVLVFPRDAHAARQCVDGRWERNEFGSPTVQMCPVRHYGCCLALLTCPDEKLGAALMAHPRHCYAISTRYHADNDADRLTTYSAFDFSLFGDDLLPGDQRIVKVRLALTELDSGASQAMEMYRAFLAEVEKQFGLSRKEPSHG